MVVSCPASGEGQGQLGGAIIVVPRFISLYMEIIMEIIIVKKENILEIHVMDTNYPVNTFKFTRAVNRKLYYSKGWPQCTKFNSSSKEI